MKPMFNRRLSRIEAILIVCLLSIVPKAMATSYLRDIGSQPDQTYSNTDVVINGDTYLPSGVSTIQATTKDVTVTLSSGPGGDPRVRASSSSESSVFVLKTTGDNQITFDVSGYNLPFVGSTNSSKSPLVVLCEGFVTFTIANNKTVAFSHTNGSGSARAYVVLSDDVLPIMYFARADHASNSNVWVEVGKHAALGYLSTSAVGDTCKEGAILFDPSNDSTKTGRLVLEIEDKGSVVVSPRKAKSTISDADDIELKKLAGGEAFFGVLPFSVYGADVHGALKGSTLKKFVKEKTKSRRPVSETSGLLITNKNSSPFELLSDPFGNLGAQNDLEHFRGKFSGKQYGFVLGAQGILFGVFGYIDYVGLVNNSDKAPVKAVPGFKDVDPTKLLKARNWSALFVDGSEDPAAVPAEMLFFECAGLYLRSGVGQDGSIHGLSSPYPYTVRADNITSGAGDYVLDVEAPLNVFGDGSLLRQTAQIQVLSAYVTPSGAALFIDDSFCNTDFPNYPLRTFPTDHRGNLLTYNKAAVLVNDAVMLNGVTLAHTDVTHKVYEQDSVNSEPTYVGGEKWVLQGVTRPRIAFVNGRFNVQTSVALTGLDLAVPNGFDGASCYNNMSAFVFYYNGLCVDAGIGRNMIMGTRIGSTAMDACSVINADVHLNVMQESDCPSDIPTQRLAFRVAPNNSTIVGTINPNTDITSQFSMQNVYLGGNSNISIGTQLVDGAPFPFLNATFPTVAINGDFYDFTTAGGVIGLPTASNVTGVGGIFVDENGTFRVNPGRIVVLDVMVTKSGNGLVELPAHQVQFGAGFGVAEWQINASNAGPEGVVIVPAGVTLPAYTYNQLSTTLNCQDFVPYPLTGNLCHNIPVTEANITGLPTIKGTVDQLIIQGSSLGNQAYIVVDGGNVRELVFESTGHTGEAAVATIILRNNGRVGINTEHQNAVSPFAETVFGTNGITIIADGDGTVTLNEDAIINTRAAFLVGPHFTENNVLEITSNTPRELLVKSNGVFDMQSFQAGDTTNQTLRIGGQINLVMESGSKLIGAGGTLQIAEDATMTMDPYLQANEFFNSLAVGALDATLPVTTTPVSDPHNPFAPLSGVNATQTDSFRTKIIGTLDIQVNDDGRVQIDQDAFVGVETFHDEFCDITTTNITVTLNDNAQFNLGGERTPQGGSFQIGNTSPQVDDTVQFSLFVNGTDSSFYMGPLTFLGLNGGIVNKRDSQFNPSTGLITPVPVNGFFDQNISNGWLVQPLYNVASINITLTDGVFKHAQIFNGDNTNASLLMIGQNADGLTPRFSFSCVNGTTVENEVVSFANVQGGGNIVRVNADGNGDVFMPIVQTQDDVPLVDGVPAPNLVVGILASLPLLPKPTALELVSADELFAGIKTTEAITDPASRDYNLADAAGEGIVTSAVSPLYVGYIDRGMIGRQAIFNVIDITGGTQPTRVANAASVGGVSVAVDTTQPAPGPVINVTQLNVGATQFNVD